MSWEIKIELKKNLYEHDKVFEWDNSVVLTDDEDGEKDNDKEMDWFSIPLEEIQATGWDEYEEPARCLPSIVGS
ncbi:hypothetical protein PVK06_033609 [Gossypium arboreum]|uniref:Uncharacterized protein n=1 Tax=Gossypium arboreum TaxID=29729 RepID=A0ABR0NBX6_GOSAR|nr:hypothetical protein PVK06_033609 [Gossypium arboreum]